MNFKKIDFSKMQFWKHHTQNTHDAPDAPPKERIPVKFSKKRMASLAVVSVLSLIFFFAAGGLLFVNNMLNRLDRTNITGNESLSESDIYGDESKFNVSDSIDDLNDTKQDFENAQEHSLYQENGVENILLIGSDRRSTSENGRSDSMMMVSINRNTGKVHLVSLMRAMYVYIPKSSGATWGMLNASYSWGGPSLLIDTIEANFRVHIDHYVVVDFSSFTTVINMVGGVDISLSAAEAQYMRNYIYGTFVTGNNTLNGDQALVYSRMRYVDNDFMRTGRQRTVIMAVLNKAKNMNAGQLMSLANQILPMINTDMSNTQVLSYISQAGTLLSYPITQMMLPVENQDGATYTGMMYVNGMEVYKVNFSNNITKLKEFLHS